MLSPLELIATLFTLTAGFVWLNKRFLGLPETIGILVMGLAASLILIAVELSFPNATLYRDAVRLILQVDLQKALLDGMLAFLLFAGAIHVDLSALRNRAHVVVVMATLGVAVSTAIVGFGVWYISAWLHVPMPLSWAFVFGALISPTDPVAVLSTLKAVRVPGTLETDMIGESLFNDGVGIVAFTVAIATTGADAGSTGVLNIAGLLAAEIVGGASLGLVAGYIAYRAIRQIDDYSVEVLISLALVAGTYAVASRVGVSGPIAVVVAGILLGNRGPRYAMSDITQQYLFDFWRLIDELLNSILFLLIGLEVLVLRIAPLLGWVPLLAVPLVLFARWMAVSLPVLLLGRRRTFAKGTIRILTWGGLRGGISVALALSIAEGEHKATILAATYLVVVFAMVVQGLSLRRLVASVCADPENER